MLRAKLEEDYQRQRDEAYASLVKTETKFQDRYHQLSDSMLTFMQRNSVTRGVSHHVSMANGSPDFGEYLLKATHDMLEAELNQVHEQLLGISQRLMELEALPASRTVFSEGQIVVSPQPQGRYAMFFTGALAFCIPFVVVTLFWSIIRWAERSATAIAASL